MEATDLIAEAGIVNVRRSRQPGRPVVAMYRPGTLLAADEGWVTICLTHNRFVTHTTRRLAAWHLSDPHGWCEVCNGDEL